MDLDLDDFDSGVLVSDFSENPDTFKTFSVQDALTTINIWYTERNRRGRRMDLIGDYAGSEPFILDGESLIQNVLDDSLLAIGRAEEPSYQLLHAKHSLEYSLDQFLSRSAAFDIVFFGENRHLTLKTGSSPFIVSSRALARRQLFNHLKNIKAPLYFFTNVQDPQWIKYLTHKKPMFIMTNDGGSCSNGTFEIEAILCQRTFLFNMMSHAVPVVLFRGVEFRDSKILSFVFEQGLVKDPHEQLPEAFWAMTSKALADLNREECRVFLGNPILPLNLPSRTFPAHFESFYDSLQEKMKNNLYPELLWVFLAHCQLLPHLSVRDRARKHEPNHPELQNFLVHAFLPQVFIILEEFLAHCNADLDVDGRIFGFLLKTLLLQSDVSPRDVVGPEVFSRSGGTTHTFSTLSSRFPPPPFDTAQPSICSPIRLLPFQHEVFDEQLSLIRVPLNDDDDIFFGELEFGRDTIFDDQHHWHNHNRLILPKHLGGEDPRPKDVWQRQRMLKRNQRFMAKLGRDAATLTGALGAKFDRITIVPAGSQQTVKTRATPSRVKAVPQQTGKKGKKAPFVSSKEKLLQEIRKQKGSDEDEGNHRWWLGQLQNLLELSSDARLAHLQRLERNPRAQKGWLSIELRLCRLHHLISEWVAHTADQESAAVRDGYTIMIMRIVKELYESKELTPTAHEKLSVVLAVLGFEDYAPTDLPSVEDCKLSFDFIKLIKTKSRKPIYKFMRISEHPIVWQLRVFGEFMDRSMGSKPDPRVSFEPDAWQRNVLDCLDRNESILVVAPTSAGKTFISFYAMEQILRETDDGILVYVAPTKALVSQIAAEIYARFSKELKTGTCWAVHTRDYRVNDPQKCQILVTVPEMLSIMMLSPPLARTWLPRVKRIIMDEIHTIGQQDGGAVWEQILLLAPCPIIGLSATIGEPEAFNEWLRSVQAAHGFKHSFIHHPHRYSHLRKFYYLLQDANAAPQKFEGLIKHKSTDRMKFIHPISILSFGARSIPQDLSLEARDTLLLYEALKSCPGVVSPTDLEGLEPARFFSFPRLLRQEDILRYESALKEVITKLMSSDQNGPSSPLRQVTEKLTNANVRRLTDVQLNGLPEKHRFQSQLINLVSDLHAQGDLPALLFNFDRTACENMAYDLLEELEQAEENWRSTSIEWKRKILAYQSWQEKAKQRERQLERATKQKTDEDAPLHEALDTSWEASFDPDEPSALFSFAGTTSYSKADLQKEIENLGYTSTDTRALTALRRGIGIHHAGMNKGYRSLVESLFRQGFLRIVIATGTLALGINAPTKTAVFCGDSPFLTALMYRQCAGRAGRRGYDLLGKVVFYGLAFDRVQRLILSKLPSLGGNFPLTSTLVLRLLNLVEGSNSAPVAVNAIKSLLTLPQVVCRSKAGGHQFVHHLRFSIEYLRRARLLDYQGKPMNLFGIAAHLYYTEPGNLALVALLRAGVLHKICSNPSMVAAKQDLILLMAHLFGRKYLPWAYTTDWNLKEIVRRSSSIVVLPRLNKRARRVLLDHEEDILRIFTSYASTYATQNSAELGEDTELPLSKIRYDGSPSDGSLFRKRIEETSLPVVARSTFVANSGHGDDFKSISELARTTRSGLHLNEYAIPSMGGITAIPDEKDEVFELNAYIYDFYMHGQTVALAKANGIRRGDVWYLLQDFELSLMTIRGVIEQLLLRASQEADVQSHAEEEGLEIDSGYGPSDPAEGDEGHDGDDRPGITRPSRVNDGDWRVYEVLNEALTEFGAKFKAMWA